MQASDVLALDVDVLVYSNPEDPKRRGLSIRHPGALPVRKGDNVRVEVKVRGNVNVYLYVVWIDSTGEAHPLYPWVGFEWENHPETEKRLSLSLPFIKAAQDLIGWPIDTDAGIETVVVMADQIPLEGEEVMMFPDSWTAFPSDKTLSEKEEPFEITLVKEGLGEDIKLGHSPVAINDPKLKTEVLLRERHSSRFALIHAVGFANVGSDNNCVPGRRELFRGREDTLAILKGIYIIGCAFRNATGNGEGERINSLNKASGWLAEKNCLISHVKSMLSSYVNEADDDIRTYAENNPPAFKQYVESSDESIWHRKGEDERPLKPNGLRDGCDRRQVIGLTPIGWQVWEEIRQILAANDPEFHIYKLCR